MTASPARIRSRRAHRILVTAFVLSPLLVLVILVLVMLRTIEQRAARGGAGGGERASQSAAPDVDGPAQ